MLILIWGEGFFTQKPSSSSRYIWNIVIQLSDEGITVQQHMIWSVYISPTIYNPKNLHLRGGVPGCLFYSLKAESLEYFESGNYFGPRNTKTHWVNFWQNYIMKIPNITDRKIAKFRRDVVVSSQTPHQKHEPAQNELGKDWKKFRLS